MPRQKITTIEPGPYVRIGPQFRSKRIHIVDDQVPLTEGLPRDPASPRRWTDGATLCGMGFGVPKSDDDWGYGGDDYFIINRPPTCTNCWKEQQKRAQIQQNQPS